MAVLSTPGPMAVLSTETTGWPDLQISAANCNFAIILHNQFISGRVKLFSAQAGPMAVVSMAGPLAVLSTPGPMAGLVAVLSRPTCKLTKRGSLAFLSLTASFIVPNGQAKAARRPFYRP